MDCLPKHDLYVEYFFGAGGMFFAKPRAKYNICNDLDNDVVNVYQLAQNEDTNILLRKEIELMPIHDTLFDYWKNNTESEPIKKAVRYLFLSNFSYKGDNTTLRKGFQNTKEILINNIEKTLLLTKKVQFTCTDFRNVLNEIAFTHKQRDKDRTFIYADPPYLGRKNNYPDNCQFVLQDTFDLVDNLVNSGCNFAISEFPSDEILNIADKYNLYITYLKERINLGKPERELILTNYQVKNLFN